MMNIDDGTLLWVCLRDGRNQSVTTVLWCSVEQNADGRSRMTDVAMHPLSASLTARNKRSATDSEWILFAGRSRLLSQLRRLLSLKSSLLALRLHNSLACSRSI
jgi:hypothetical protein